MNNPRITIVALAALGIGSVGGFLVARRLLEQHYAEIAQLEIDSVKNYYRKKYEGRDDPTIEQEKEAEKHRELVERYKKPDLHELATNGDQDDDGAEEVEEDNEEIEEDEDLDEDDVLMANDADYALDPKKEPYLIDYDEFVKPTDIFEKIELYYYRFDNVTCTADDIIMNDPQSELGWEWMKLLETKTTAFVRNERLASDYEIHSFSKSYKEEISSRLETDKEKKFRRQARKKEAMDSSSEEFMKYEKEALAEKKIAKKKTEYNRQIKKQMESISEEE